MILGASRARLSATLLLVALSSGCISVHRPWFMEPTIDRDWDNTLLLARVRAAEGKFGAADTLLSRFATQYPGTHEALETAYWRALFDLDPSNHVASFTSAMASLDAYLSERRPREHAAEAATLRRIAGHMDELNKLAATALAEARDSSATARVTAPDPRVDARPPVAGDVSLPTPADAEIKRLKDELAKANAELERIRRRLAQPPPSKP
jgi:hypothetical protein